SKFIENQNEQKFSNLVKIAEKKNFKITIFENTAWFEDVLKSSLNPNFDFFIDNYFDKSNQTQQDCDDDYTPSSRLKF
ncbi:hypothetical protein OFN99_09185, partial [Campylobacter sp. JMF_03 NE3]|nr:hypothetical protein [Campylobacter sp. JMF_03 NE3]